MRWRYNYKSIPPLHLQLNPYLRRPGRTYSYPALPTNQLTNGTRQNNGKKCTPLPSPPPTFPQTSTQLTCPSTSETNTETKTALSKTVLPKAHYNYYQQQQHICHGRHPAKIPPPPPQPPQSPSATSSIFPHTESGLPPPRRGAHFESDAREGVEQ